MKEITKYKNRKLYDKDLTRYINLMDISKYINEDVAFIVKTKEGMDITDEIVSRTLFEVQLNYGWINIHSSKTIIKNILTGHRQLLKGEIK